MRFRAALQSKAGVLTDSDRRIGNTLLMSSLDVKDLTAAQLAAKAEVHESTVVRFAQKLGYAGYPELRAELVDDIHHQALVSSSRRSTDRDPTLEAVVAAQVELISDLPRMISQATIDSTADTLLNASQVLVIGRGLMTAPAAFLSRKLSLVGIPTVHSSQGGAEAVERAALLREGDAVVMFAFNDEYAGFAPLMVALARRGVRGVLITDQESLFHQDLPENVLTVPRRHTDHGVMGALVVVGYAIEYAVLAKAPERSTQAWRQFADLATSSQLDHATNGFREQRDFGQSGPEQS